MKSSTIRSILGLLIVLVGLFLPQIQERIPDLIPDSVPSIQILEPNEEIKEKTSSIAAKVTDPKDRLELCVFNKTFSERLLGYDSTVQQLNDVYVESAKILFKDSLAGKYQGYGDGVTSLISEITGSENHELTDFEKEQISKVFNGLAWNLSQ